MSDTANPAHVERDLDETRSRLDTHLSQLQDRLSPGQVLDDLMAYFRGSEGAAFGRNLMDNVRDNPLPAALTGIGLAWLMASNPRPGATTSHSGKVRVHLHHYGREDYDTTMMRVREAEQGVQRQSDESDYAYSTRVDAARGQAIGLARHAQETAGSFGQRVRDALSAAQQSVSETAQNARDQAANAMNTAAGAVGSIGSSAQGTAQGAARYAGGALSSG
ncbi:MAG TPA: DUF3618 domain-containing protein, partial [Rhodopila sp.]|nr:DUF3618 domain-containing protein [Rhodopila sp.]